ncbi:MAG: DnaJ domain-containing protein [Clostridia bacterium]|nr:DnaJ domain-containing protein [Clostridia bacterium]
MIFKDYYKILNLETNKVTIEEIRIAYRLAAKKNHPDLNVGDRLAEEKIKDINEAYRVLSNSTTKRKYDRMWVTSVLKKRQNYEESKRTTGSVFSDFFNMFFGTIKEKNDQFTEKSTKEKGENVETEIDITIEEGFYGKNKKISLRTVEGSIKTFSVDVPAGIRNGEKIRLIGQGKQGKNGGKNGDLLIKVNIGNSSRFKLKGYDLYTDLLLTPWEAALGTKTDINGIDESNQIYIPQGTQSGEKITIPEKGYKIGNGARGDLIAEVKIMVPKNLSEEETKEFKKLNEISKFNPRNS